MIVNFAIAKRIRDLLDERNMSLYKLEKDACIPHSTMMSLMNCKRESCTVKTVILIARTLGLTVSEFFNDDIFENEELHID